MIRRAFVDTSFGQVHVRTAGSGAPLVLLHQSPDSSESYLPVMPCLADRFRVIAIDTIGFGESAKPASPPGIEGYARSVVEVLDGLGIDRASLLGHHTGASIAVEVAATVPNRIDRLILSGCPDYDPDVRAEKLAEAKPAVIATDGSHIARSWAAMSDRFGVCPWATPEGIQRVVIDSLKAGPTWYYAYLAVFGQDVRQRIPRITAPTLLMGSRIDPLVARHEQLRPLFTQAETIEMDTPGALTMLDDPDMFCRIVTDFLSR